LNENDDAGEAPELEIFGEVVDAKCSPEFITRPPPVCSTERIEVPAFRGEFCWFIFPGSEWETTSPVGKLVEAQAFYRKYCFYFNFTQQTLAANRANEYEEWYAEWKARVRKSVIPDKHIPALRRRLVAQNPGLSSDRINNLVESEIRRILRAASIPGDLHEEFYREMVQLQAEVTGDACRNTLIVFIDEYICYNPKPTRASACQLKFNQIGITAVDSASRNVLAHEMVHLLGKPAPNRGGKVTWEHERCSNSVLHVTRANWWAPFPFADLLSSSAYQEIILNQNGAKVRLIEPVQ
jgi:hypothetical protein